MGVTVKPNPLRFDAPVFPYTYAIGIALGSSLLMLGTYGLLLFLCLREKKARKDYEIKRKISAPVPLLPRVNAHAIDKGNYREMRISTIQGREWVNDPEWRV